MLSKKEKKKIIYSAPSVILIVVIAFALLHGTISAYGKMKESREKRNLAESEQKELEQRFNHINEKVNYLQTEKGLEEAIRTKYNVAKEGEEVFVVIDNKTDKEEQEVERSIWTIFFDQLTGVFK